MREQLRRHRQSFQNALQGFWWIIREHPNFRIHIAISVLVLVAAYEVGVTRVERIILIFAILVGLTAEMINTALESITDLVTREWRSEAKIAKDVSAAMMLVVAVGATIVGISIFLPYVSGRIIP
jgi:diacylglycerol kinase